MADEKSQDREWPPVDGADMADEKSQGQEWPPKDGAKELDFAFATYNPLVAVLTWSLRIATYIFLRHVSV